MSGVMVKTAVYGYLRFILLGLGVQDVWWGVVVLIIGLASALEGALSAQKQHDMKRLLAYSTVENMGIITIGLGIGTLGMALQLGALATLGLTASLFHVAGHSLFKGLLFLGAGSVQHGAGTRQLSFLGGLNHRMVWTGTFMLIGTLSITALPPLIGFTSEWMSLKSAYALFNSTAPSEIRFAGFIAVMCLALTGGLVASIFIRFYGTAFLGLPRSQKAADARESNLLMIIPMGILAAGCFVIGLVPSLTQTIVLPVLEQLHLVMPTLGGFGIRWSV
jgi:hydrogenase-4 component B